MSPAHNGESILPPSFSKSFSGMQLCTRNADYVMMIMLQQGQPALYSHP